MNAETQFLIMVFKAETRKAVQKKILESIFTNKTFQIWQAIFPQGIQPRFFFLFNE